MKEGKVICDIDNQGDIFRAKAEIGHHVCLAGGIPDTMLILGNPQKIRERVKLLCETVAKDGGFIINGGCNIPYDTKPENFRAMIDAVIEYGTYDRSIQHVPRQPAAGERKIQQKMLTPWAAKLEELGGIYGDEEMIRRPWEMLETMGYNWLWQWVM